MINKQLNHPTELIHHQQKITINSKKNYRNYWLAHTLVKKSRDWLTLSHHHLLVINARANGNKGKEGGWIVERICAHNIQGATICFGSLSLALSAPGTTKANPVSRLNERPSNPMWTACLTWPIGPEIKLRVNFGCGFLCCCCCCCLPGNIERIFPEDNKLYK